MMKQMGKRGRRKALATSFGYIQLVPPMLSFLFFWKGKVSNQTMLCYSSEYLKGITRRSIQ